MHRHARTRDMQNHETYKLADKIAHTQNIGNKHTVYASCATRLRAVHATAAMHAHATQRRAEQYVVPHSPAMTPSMIAASSTVLDKGPMQSKEEP